MSYGPVYCPVDGTELVWDSHKFCFRCVGCGLQWNGHFPIQDNVPIEKEKDAQNA